MDEFVEDIFADLDNDNNNPSTKSICGEKKTRRCRKVDGNWLDEKCYQLIELVEERANLWDVSKTEYKNRSKREISWEEIGKIINLPKDEVANKWNLLRQQFRVSKNHY